MKISKELEALVVSTLARMPAEQFRRTLKLALDGRRTPSEKPPVKKRSSPAKPKKKVHWKTQQMLDRLAAEKKANKKSGYKTKK